MTLAFAERREKIAHPFSQNCLKSLILRLDGGRKPNRIHPMNVTLPLKEMTIAEKIGVMEDIWFDLSNSGKGYSPPDWHDRILEERARLAESGEVGFTDWETAKRQINDRVS